MRILRFLKIARISLRFGLDQMILEHEPSGLLMRIANGILFWRDLSTPRAVRLRLALEALGPIFVKFGQVLSTRRDLMPHGYRRRTGQTAGPGAAVSLASRRAAELERAYGRPVDEVFAEFDAMPVASASVAQVHFAGCCQDGGHEVAVKILRPGIATVIGHDIALLEVGGRRCWKGSGRTASA